MAEADIAVIGLAVMGQNLILNMNDHNFTVSFVTILAVFVEISNILHHIAKSTAFLLAD